MYLVLEKVGREVAPHLKTLMPIWYLSQVDPHAPAASAALGALKIAFPTDIKANEAIMFCQAEILAVIEDNLLVQTPQTLSDPK